jgi:hypothetical protein
VASAGLLLGYGLTACGADVAEPQLGRAAQPIFGGDLDPNHPEVMLLFDQAGAVCTGTNIRSENGSGFLLTAAHCVTDELVGGGVVPLAPEQLLVVPGADFLLSPIAFSGTAVAVEPDYVGGFAADDIAVVRFFTGNEPPPPAIEPLGAADDTLAVNDELLLIGYGDTEAGGLNTERRRVTRDVAGLDDELVVYSQEDGSGPCFGDSGGPGLASVAGAERVAVVISGGVESLGQASCSSGIGVATRVSGYEGFITTALDQLATP